MVNGDATGNGITPTFGARIPTEGLNEVLRIWSGRGHLLSAIASVADEQLSEIIWNADDVRMRASRILFELLKPHFHRLPTRVASWLDAIPANIRPRKETSDSIFPGVSWTDTYKRFGWPPSSFIGKTKTRGTDLNLVTTAAWTLSNIQELREAALHLSPSADKDIVKQLNSVGDLFNEEPFFSADYFGLPDLSDIKAMRAEGRPWHNLADIAEQIFLIYRDAKQFALQLLSPDDEIRWRLFHLGILGEVLLGLTSAGCKIRSLRPIRASSTEPSFQLTSPRGHEWDLWFEGSGIWNFYKVSPPYKAVNKGAKTKGTRLSPDIILTRSPEQALIFECKFYDSNIARMVRDGYLQVSAYVNEVKTCLAANVMGVVIAPATDIPCFGLSNTVSGKVGIAPHIAVRQIVSDFVS